MTLESCDSPMREGASLSHIFGRTGSGGRSCVGYVLRGVGCINLICPNPQYRRICRRGAALGSLHPPSVFTPSLIQFHPLFPGFAPSLELTIHVCRRRVSVFKRRRRLTLSEGGRRASIFWSLRPNPISPLSVAITHVEFVPIPRVSRTLARIELCQVPMLRRAVTPVALSVIPILRRPIKNRKCVSHYVTYRRSSLLFPSPPSLPSFPSGYLA